MTESDLKTAPPGWNRGELLKYDRTSMTCERATPFDPPPYPNMPNTTPKQIRFENTYDAQEFMSWWYAPAAVRAMEQG